MDLMRLRREISAGTYFDDHKLDVTVRRLFAEISQMTIDKPGESSILPIGSGDLLSWAYKP